jgi:hypothetical protein
VRPADTYGLRAEEKNGATPRSLAPDAYDCIMDTVEPTTQYKAVEEHAPPTPAGSPQIVTIEHAIPSNEGGHTPGSFSLDNKRPIQGGAKRRKGLRDGK